MAIHSDVILLTELPLSDWQVYKSTLLMDMSFRSNHELLENSRNKGWFHYWSKAGFILGSDLGLSMWFWRSTCMLCGYVLQGKGKLIQLWGLVGMSYELRNFLHVVSSIYFSYILFWWEKFKKLYLLINEECHLGEVKKMLLFFCHISRFYYEFTRPYRYVYNIDNVTD